MHISDGVLSGPVLATGFALTAAIAGATLRRIDVEEIPKISVVTSAFFVASLIHFPVGTFSLHLILNGLVGIILGWRAFPAILLGIVLQAILFGHGGVSVIGVNTTMMGIGALAAYGVWRLRDRVQLPRLQARQRHIVFGALAGAVSIIASGFILALALVTTGEAFVAIASLAFVYHIPLMLIEGAVAGTCVAFLLRVKPTILADYQPPPSGT